MSNRETTPNEGGSTTDVPATREAVLERLAARRPREASAKPDTRVFRHAADPASRPPPKPTNGGPRVYASAVEELTDIGLTIYTPDAWIPRLARDIGEHPRQVRRWVNGEAEITPVAVMRARMAVKAHIARLRKLLVRLGEEA